MVAPSNSPVVTSVPLAGSSYVLGEVTDAFGPLKSQTYYASIPGTLLGNEVAAGFACFTTDQVLVTKGSAGFTLANFIGFAQLFTYQEWDPGSLSGAFSLPSKFSVPVLRIGSIYVYNSSAIVTTVSSGAKIIITNDGTTPAALVGSVWQGADPAGCTTVDVSTVVNIRTANITVGGGILLDILRK